MTPTTIPTPSPFLNAPDSRPDYLLLFESMLKASVLIPARGSSPHCDSLKSHHGSADPNFCRQYYGTNAPTTDVNPNPSIANEIMTKLPSRIMQLLDGKFYGIQWKGNPIYSIRSCGSSRSCSSSPLFPVGTVPSNLPTHRSHLTYLQRWSRISTPT